MNLGTAPPWNHFSDPKHRATLSVLREKCAPILANNLLPHFTDHSVDHSDRITVLADQLLEGCEPVLSDDELLVLYGACYLHDIGMQYERAGETDALLALDLIPPWSEQSDAGKRNLLRDFHHQISAELVLNSVRSESPPIGIQLTQDVHPSYIARLCRAHCISTDTSEYEYAELVKDGPNIRMQLLCALLRLGDILDESRRRATRERARTLELDLESQTHWWRHYYVEDITFDVKDRRITVWFDFPPQRFAEYAGVVPLLQMQQIEEEFRRHEHVLRSNGINWSVRQESQSKLYSDTENMPEPVLTAMLKQLAARRRKVDEEHRLLALNQFREARPSIERRLTSLKDKEPTSEPAEYLLELSKISFDLFELGGRRGARSVLHGRYIKDCEHLERDDRIDIGLRLLRWFVEDGQEFDALQLVEKLAPSLQELRKRPPQPFLTTGLC